MTIIADYGVGNLRSVKNALHRLGEEYLVSADSDALISARRVILPGVGDASEAMKKLKTSGLAQIIPQLTCPVLGICVGMQLMCSSSEEGPTQCLGIFPTKVVKLHDGRLKVPHVGWDSIASLRSPLLKGLIEEEMVYYVHSFAPELCSNTIAVTDYCSPFSAALASGNFFGTQFHPEKSGSAGAKILENFLQL